MKRAARTALFVLAAPSLLLLLACETPPDPIWTRPGASDVDREAAIRACLAEAEGDVPARGSESHERQQVDVRGSVFLRCMKDRGWTQVRPE